MSEALRLALYTAWRRRFAPLAWGLPLGLMSLMIVGVFPSIEENADVEKLLESYPDTFKDAFGVTDASFSSIQGYLGAEIFNLIAPFAICFFLIRALSDAVCGSEHRGALDVLLSAPLSRRQLVAGWLLGNTAVLLGVLALFGVLTWIGGPLFGVDLPAGDVAAGVLNMLPLALCFGGVTLLFAGLLHRSGAVTGIAAGVLVTMYLVETLGSLSDAIDAFRPLSAFHYYGAALENGLDAGDFFGLVAAGLVLAVAGALLFERRDIR